MNKRILTVSELNTYVKYKIEDDVLLSNLWIKGEISNYKAHSSGHRYFVLKDQTSSVRCVMFRSRAAALKFEPEQGISVLLQGYLSVYERDGNYQIYVEEMQPEGVGALHLAFEQLKAKLAKEGLFDDQHKKPLPFLPRKIGVVTSPTGAVWQDIQKVALARFPNIHIVLAPAAVQGESAAGEIVRGIQVLNQVKELDVIIVGRGGGSLEDLWAFNMEEVARAIFHSQVPVISAVGHQTDFTIADFVADQRAATPSAAAEMAVPVKRDLLKTISLWQSKMEKAAASTLTLGRQRLAYMEQRTVLHNPERLLQGKEQYLDTLKLTLEREIQDKMKDLKNRYQLLAEKMDMLSPLTTLSRGYAVCLKDAKVITSEAEVAEGDLVQVVLAQGNIHCQVQSKEKGGIFDGREKNNI
ncbi:exodeoxyribonuclease VII large subunit [Dehalobacterium formicoaceticum]|uniref:Exodeoxyribonuclease 7 large subunit n=1 Tax=Dehalobacterium formicoaceticum TaxID=51515 RepID=A0ABT1Y4J4_9FIRM|nr:exodeoxyribonuclease VII large subunit [Dehalobacterium formicoaceticum]MCR6545796.1 exodeoxyribonuclease VII large subunit [Dehalobacterium formicoaceticum]